MAQYSFHRPWAPEPRGAFDDLRRELNSLLGRYGSGVSGGRRGVFPATNLYESEDAYMLTAEIPGVSPSDIQVSIEGSTVTFRGERMIDRGNGDTNIHRLERRSGTFRRAFELPVSVDPEKAEAVHKNGVLMLRLPKTPEQQPHRIAVQTG